MERLERVGSASQTPPRKRRRVAPAITITTGVRCDEIKFQWRIENFSVIRHCKKMLQAQEFTITLGEAVGIPCKWTFSITSELETITTPAAQPGEPFVTSTVEWLEIVRKLVQVPEQNMEICNSCSLKIKDKDRKSFFKGYGSVNNLKLNGYRTFKKVLKMNEKSEQLPLIENSLVIDFTVRTYATRPTYYANPAASLQFKEQMDDKLKIDLIAMLKGDGGSSDYSDVKIISKDGKEFPVHKNILGARNSVFQAMFASNLSEGQTGIIQLEDLNGKALGILLEYIYAGVLQENWFQPDVLVELTYAAGKYQLTEVLEYLNAVLGEQGKGENAGVLLALCEKLGLSKAEKELMDYVKTRAVPSAGSYSDLVAILGNYPDNMNGFGGITEVE